MTTYLSQTARREVEAAQRVIETHAISAITGLCAACRVEGPCRPHRQALKTLQRYGVLPRRIPGATLPERDAGPMTWWGFGPVRAPEPTPYQRRG